MVADSHRSLEVLNKAPVVACIAVQAGHSPGAAHMALVGGLPADSLEAVHKPPVAVREAHSDETVAHACNLVVRIAIPAAVVAVLPMVVHPLA